MRWTPARGSGLIVPMLPVRVPTVPRAIKVVVGPIGADDESQDGQPNRCASFGNIDFPIFEGRAEVIRSNPTTQRLDPHVTPLVIALTSRHFNGRALAQSVDGYSGRPWTTGKSRSGPAQVQISIGQCRIGSHVRTCQDGAHHGQPAQGDLQALVNGCLHGKERLCRHHQMCYPVHREDRQIALSQWPDYVGHIEPT